MKEFRNPVFDMGVIGVLVFLIGIFLRNSYLHTGNIVLWTGIGICILFSLISIVEVLRTHTLKGEKKVFWIMIVLLVPVFGSFIYYIFTRKNESKVIE